MEEAFLVGAAANLVAATAPAVATADWEIKLRRVHARSSFMIASFFCGLEEGFAEKHFVALVLKKDSSTCWEYVIDLVHSNSIHLD
jgi:hypothetical protein